ncbi:MAG: class I SAM-dependent methyltransferase [Desulfobacterales bacterium]|nr:class I SAM-dependent methyltransferase [Desulfobacterales bacterium]
MENEQESLRLELKSDRETIRQQALWAGIKPGMRVADIGCGSGKSTYVLNQMVQPGGESVGIDFSIKRIAYSTDHYSAKNIKFVCRNFLEPLHDLGMFDFIWVRFVLEYFKSSGFEIVKKLSEYLKPGGIMCLIDLDHNCMNHFDAPEPLQKTLHGVMGQLESSKDFDPYAGRKLYSFLHDLNYEEIDAKITAHHLIFGKLNKTDEFNWITKLKVAVKNSGYDFNEYEQGFEGFFEEFTKFFSNPRRFTYTPLISCRGRRPI